MIPKKKFFLFIVFFTLIITYNINAQNIREIKTAAKTHMDAGRYGEAIDLLNKVISANPREYEGYFLRGFCFEKRTQYEAAVVDFRRAAKLNPKNNKVRTELEKLTQKWYAELNKQIQGYRREIAINPEKPNNYLGIGKAYKNLDDWKQAEQWYDKYLEREPNASADEIIRYTEILAKNKQITKGEKVLKIWVEKYPSDWRLLSKYGYFTMWMGRRRNAEEAFEKALEIKPFFKEAMDGLELAQRKPYIVKLSEGTDKIKEFPIDRYYRILKQNPEKTDIRYNLIDELVKNNRFEEAFQQLQTLSKTEGANQEFEKKWEYVTNLRDKIYRSKLQEYLNEIKKNSNDKKSIKKAVQYYEYLQEYDSALELLNNYLDKNPNEKDEEIFFLYAKLSAWNKDYDTANEKIDFLLSVKPNNSKYKLFKAQLLVWNKEQLDKAENLLDEVIKKEPNNLSAIISMGSLCLAKDDIECAKEYLAKAKSINSTDPSVVQLESNIDFHYEVLKERKIYAELEEARKLFRDGDCKGAILLYESYIAKAEPNELVLKEYADANFCDSNYSKAVEIYDKILETDNNPDVAIQRAKVLYAMGDSIKSVVAFKQIVKENPEDFNANLYLADSYSKLGAYDSANAIYDSLLTFELDSSEVVLIEQRKKWIPATDFISVLENFPNYIGLQPSAGFYSDNLSFKILYAGGRLELGVNNFITLGVSFTKYFIDGTVSYSNDYKVPIDISFTSFKGSLFLRLSKYLTAGGAWGYVTPEGYQRKQEQDFFAEYTIKKKFNLRGSYASTDAALLLFSPYLVSTRLDADIYKVESFYETPQGIKFFGSYQYLTVSDDNKGEDLKLRVGKRFFKNIVAGYEYNYANWHFYTSLYYTPTNGFESHALWADWEVEQDTEYKIFIGGRLGYVAKSEFLIREIYSEAKYFITEKFSIVGKLTLGSTYRFEDNYTYASGMISAYYNF